MNRGNIFNSEWGNWKAGTEEVLFQILWSAREFFLILGITGLFRHKVHTSVLTIWTCTKWRCLIPISVSGSWGHSATERTKPPEMRHHACQLNFTLQERVYRNGRVCVPEFMYMFYPPFTENEMEGDIYSENVDRSHCHLCKVTRDVDRLKFQKIGAPDKCSRCPRGQTPHSLLLFHHPPEPHMPWRERKLPRLRGHRSASSWS